MPSSKKGRDVIHLCGGWSPDSYPTKAVAPIKLLRGGHVDGIKFDYIKDTEAKRFEGIQKIPFLFTGRIPQESMRTETEVVVKGVRARFSGVISEIHPPPTKKELKNLSRPFSCGCRRNDPTCKFRNGVKRAFGADHGQRITGLAVLNFDYYDKMKGLVDPNRIYEVEYRLESNKDCVWIGAGAKKVDDVDIDDLRHTIWPSWRRYGKCCPPESAPNAGTLATLDKCLDVFETGTSAAASMDVPCIHTLVVSKEQYQSNVKDLLDVLLIATPERQSNQLHPKDHVLMRNLIEKNVHKIQCFECSRSILIHLLNHLHRLDGAANLFIRSDSFCLQYLMGMSSLHFQFARLIFSETDIGRHIFMHDLNSENSSLGGTFAANVYRWRRKDWLHLSRTCKGNRDDIVLDIVAKLARLCGEGWTSYYRNSDTSSVKNVLFSVHTWFVILVFAMRRLRYDVSRSTLPAEIESLFRRRHRGLNVKIEEDDGLFGWIRGCTVMLFDEHYSRNYNFFYQSIKQYSIESRDTLRENSQCSNSKCNIWVPDCKYVCAKCRCGIYCSRRCQKYDWNRGEHRLLCKQTKFA